MDNRVEIRKNVELQDGEELMQFVDKVINAVEGIAKQKKKFGDREVEIPKFFLRGIFKNFLVLRERETEKFFRVNFTRAKDGSIKIDKAKMVEVKQAFVPCNSDNVKKSEDGDADEPRLVELPALTLVAKGDRLTEESLNVLTEILKGQEEDPGSEFVDVEEKEEPKEAGLWDNVIR